MLTRLAALVRAMTQRHRANAEVDDELAFHLEQETAKNIADGMSPGEARRLALRDLGGVTQTIEAVRDVRMTWVDAVRQDTGYAWRRFARERGPFAAVVLTVALGIGGTTATYSVVYGVLLRPLPVADEASLVVAYRTDHTSNSSTISYPWFELWRRSGALEDMAATRWGQLDISGFPGAERIETASVSDNFFRVLGVQPALGRSFATAERQTPEIPVVISDALWRRRYGADPNVIGMPLTAAALRDPAVIVGVMPPGFERWRGRADAWLPIERTTEPSILSSPGYSIVTPIGRLAATSSLSEATAVLAAVPDPSSSNVERGVRVVGLRDDVVPPRIERLLLVVLAVMLLTWLVMCANLSMLLLERGARRSREWAVRLALGASRSRVSAQMLIESSWLTIVSGVVGVGLAAWAVQLFVVSGPPALFDATTIRLDAPVLLLAIVLTVVTAIFSGLAPALRAGRPHVTLVARVSHGTPDTRLSHILIVSQIAVALVVLAGASLLVKSLVRMQQVELGFDGTHVLTAHLDLPTSRYGAWTVDNTRYIQVQRELIARLAAIPGVNGATVGTPVFTPGYDGRVTVNLEDRRRFLNGEPDHYAFAPGVHFIGPGYLDLHGIRVVSGREFREGDTVSTIHGVLINETMARLYWPDEDPLGKRLNFGRARSWTVYEEPWATVIGVVADVRHGGIDLPVKPEVYRAQFQHPRPLFEVALRTSVPPEAIMSAVRGVVRDFDPDLPVFHVRPVTDVIAETTATARYSSTLLSGLASLAVVLCAVGIFSLLAGSVAARRREIAIRLALGAVPGHLVRTVIGRAVVLLAIGSAIGGAAALFAAGTLSGLLYDVAPLDPVAHSIGIVVLAVVGIAAAWIPARRASAIDPVVALREEA